jgi:hypothetical protein
MTMARIAQLGKDLHSFSPLGGSRGSVKTVSNNVEGGLPNYRRVWH